MRSDSAFSARAADAAASLTVGSALMSSLRSAGRPGTESSPSRACVSSDATRSPLRRQLCLQRLGLEAQVPVARAAPAPSFSSCGISSSTTTLAAGLEDARRLARAPPAGPPRGGGSARGPPGPSCPRAARARAGPRARKVMLPQALALGARAAPARAPRGCWSIADHRASPSGRARPRARRCRSRSRPRRAAAAARRARSPRGTTTGPARAAAR